MSLTDTTINRTSLSQFRGFCKELDKNNNKDDLVQLAIEIGLSKTQAQNLTKRELCRKIATTLVIPPTIKIPFGANPMDVLEQLCNEFHNDVFLEETYKWAIKAGIKDVQPDMSKNALCALLTPVKIVYPSELHQQSLIPSKNISELIPSKTTSLISRAKLGELPPPNRSDMLQIFQNTKDARNNYLNSLKKKHHDVDKEYLKEVLSFPIYSMYKGGDFAKINKALSAALLGSKYNDIKFFYPVKGPIKENHTKFQKGYYLNNGKELLDYLSYGKSEPFDYKGFRSTLYNKFLLVGLFINDFILSIPRFGKPLFTYRQGGYLFEHAKVDDIICQNILLSTSFLPETAVSPGSGTTSETFTMFRVPAEYPFFSFGISENEILLPPILDNGKIAKWKVVEKRKYDVSNKYRTECYKDEINETFEDCINKLRKHGFKEVEYVIVEPYPNNDEDCNDGTQTMEEKNLELVLSKEGIYAKINNKEYLIYKGWNLTKDDLLKLKKAYEDIGMKLYLSPHSIKQRLDKKTTMREINMEYIEGYGGLVKTGLSLDEYIIVKVTLKD